MKIISIASLIISLISFVSAQTILETLVAQNSSHTGPKVSTILALASPFKAVTDVLNGTDKITAFIPTDEAIAAALKALGTTPSQDDTLKILTYHVVPGVVFKPAGIPDGIIVVKTALAAPTLGDKATQNLIVALKESTVTLRFGLSSAKVTSSVEASNGIIHYVDALLIPPQPVSVVAKAANFTSLLDAVTATNLQKPIEDAKNITIFAPTNAAFAAISDVVKTLSTSQVAAVLQYHVVPGAVFSPDVVKLPNNTEITTLLGQKFKVAFVDGAPVILGFGNKSPVKLSITDVLVANGVIHVVDAVIIPDLSKVSATPSPSPSKSASSQGSSASGSEKTVYASMSAILLSVAIAFFTSA
ncbi:hypothetical protein HK098_007919 [Nowakowskiella sp. JEL0407]|nr:hypothetical protein HK098_007919 [Nowakowskiella sp. JEL0407]